ncbi:P-loop containing nucleoside triphosphate hydrolase protein [Cladorrhinum samala]|uniref:P-loop containing nucleoside triphosphate hydrolase protein n=1 Tax=Cladorrhinum samala TaxID=585594 RepID=A0AAV9HE03_9PEZI|nr:P-loop containing nucleoside triphosphate hydrolase protein [Cladorrhinum samala]
MHDSGALMSNDRLFKIDQLRERNIGKYLPLPQLVAVGDQSSGKSSLLESVTGIPFPHGQELCTRYATQITHRRDTNSFISITIIPGPQASADHKNRVEGYHYEVESTAQLQAEFPDILNKVNICMGIRTDKNPDGDKTFTTDVLKIEKCGPDEDYLTVIDVPGIFRTTTDGVTTTKDRDMVKNMVTRYIKDSRTIILAVLPCNVDIATQEILSLAEEYDKTGQRTLGVLTKPDLVKERSAKASVCSLVMGERKTLNLGYYIVRNRGGDDDENDADLEEREDMFQQEPWSRLPQDRVGVKALRERLQDLLGEITDLAFPKIRAELRSMLLETDEALVKLGPPRQTERQQQQYLVGIAGKFQSIVRAALDADYSSNKFFSEDSAERPERRLITLIVNITHWFNSAFRNTSQTFYFKGQSEKPQDDDIKDNQNTLEDVGRLPSYVSGCPHLANIIVTNWSTDDPKTGIVAWIEENYRRSRGVELGTFSPAMLSGVFREQSRKWPTLTQQYLSMAIIAVHDFIALCLQAACGETDADKITTNRIFDGVINELVIRYERAMGQAMHLVELERERKPYTLNHYFNDNVQKSRGIQVKNYASRHAFTEMHGNPNYRQVVAINDLSKAITDKSNAEHIRDEIHENLQAYYQVASKRFIDYVYLQAVDHHLLSGPDSPLRLFSERWVLDLNAAQLAAIAGENRHITTQRQNLKMKADDLREALKIL